MGSGSARSYLHLIEARDGKKFTHKQTNRHTRIRELQLVSPNEDSQTNEGAKWLTNGHHLDRQLVAGCRLLLGGSWLAGWLAPFKAC